MHVLKTLCSPNKELTNPIALSIGVYDGLHEGHIAVLQRLKEAAGPKGTTIVISFNNNPAEIIKGQSVFPIYSNEERIALFELLKIDILFLIPFTEEIAKQSAEQFLKEIKHYLSFSHLILGYDAVLGNKREGTQEKIISLSKSLDFEVEYLPPVCDQSGPISSTRIRLLIQAGNLRDAEILLGRPYRLNH
ncbi:MAG: FAD synthetase family protein [Chlamydiales bacterium]|nr:FAD synthetase family protein [Chlamydiales bacterium]